MPRRPISHSETTGAISHSEMASKKDCSIYWFILSPEILGLEGNRVNWGWVLLGWTGLVLLCTAQNPARLVYGSAALVASLRGQHCHFATLPIIY